MFITRFPRGRPRGLPADKSVYVCEARYNEEKFKFNKIKTWTSCLPDEVRDKDYEMDLFDVPRNLRKVPSPIKHLLQADAKESDDLPKPTWRSPNAPPLIGAVHRRPRESNVSCSSLDSVICRFLGPAFVTGIHAATGPRPACFPTVLSRFCAALGAPVLLFPSSPIIPLLFARHQHSQLSLPAAAADLVDSTGKQDNKLTKDEGITASGTASTAHRGRTCATGHCAYPDSDQGQHGHGRNTDFPPSFGCRACARSIAVSFPDAAFPAAARPPAVSSPGAGPSPAAAAAHGDARAAS